MNAKEMIDVNITRMIGQLRSMATALEDVPRLLEDLTFVEEPTSPQFAPLHPSERWFISDLIEVVSARETWTAEQLRQAMIDVIAARAPVNYANALQSSILRSRPKEKSE